MKLSDVMLQEFLHEAQITKRLLERLPEDKLAWKPHEKSMSMGRLATHIAEIPQWAEIVVNHADFDMAAEDYEPSTLESRGEILEVFQKNLDNFAKVMAGKDDAHMMVHWRFREGDKVMVDLPRAAVIRGFVISHTIHHRGQLSVYLRENNVPLPSIYGPSADEQG